ncbi:Probable potassium transport system protein kup [Durusdinium trenchii]|uniref:Probable potassium transport system protein kup n=1 Tax=Durusdinium trenchii TaxID=1381693 RepID=A0ABP0I5D6_9DINO
MSSDILSVVSRPLNDRKAGARHTSFFPLVLGATGVVFGDIGTSPLYTFNSIFTELHAQPQKADVQQAFSVIFWTMTWMICYKYIGLVMRVSHHGEGGTFAMMKVILQTLRHTNHEDSTSEEDTDEEMTGIGSNPERGSCQQSVVLFLGVVSCSMLVGDGVITPPNSVLGALNSPCLQVSESWNVFIAVMILLGVFGLQRVGSRIIGWIAGPLMVLWFLTIAAMGIYQIAMNPELAAYMAHGFSPVKLYHFFVLGEFRGFRAYRAIAGVVLCVTGAEALYADMGHFGAGPITTAWFFLVWPCLTLQYFGQAIVLAADPTLINSNPLYSTVPNSLIWPVFILAALAAIIASQALISGVFTLMSQAHALGLVPRILVLHTNPDERGQVYIPEINWLLMIACILVTVAFKTSDALVSAYGIAVTGAFIFTTLLLCFVLHYVWKCCWAVTLLAILPMLMIDLVFWTANLMKVLQAGWVPLVLSGLIYFLMYSHHWGRNRELANHIHEEEEELANLHRHSKAGSRSSCCTVWGLRRHLASRDLARPDGTAFFLTPKEGRVPSSVNVLINELGSVPRTLVLLHVAYSEEPFVAESERLKWSTVDRGLGLHTATLSFGYAEPLTAARFDLDSKLAFLTQDHITRSKTAPAGRIDEEGNLTFGKVRADPHVTYIVNSKRFVAAEDSCLARAQVAIFSLLNRNSQSPVSFFGLQGQSVLEVSAVAEL